MLFLTVLGIAPPRTGQVRSTAMSFLAKYNEENPQRMMELVLFNDALQHLFRVSRLLEMPRG